MLDIVAQHEMLLGDGLRENFIQIVDGLAAENKKDGEGNEEEETVGYTREVVQKAVYEFLRTIFPEDSAEVQREYMQYCFRWTPNIKLKNMAGRLQELNRYIPYLPCLADSEHATELTVRGACERGVLGAGAGRIIFTGHADPLP